MLCNVAFYLYVKLNQTVHCNGYGNGLYDEDLISCQKNTEVSCPRNCDIPKNEQILG